MSGLQDFLPKYPIGIRVKLLIAFLLAVLVPAAALGGGLLFMVATDETFGLLPQQVSAGFLPTFAKSVGDAHARYANWDEAVVAAEIGDLPPGWRLLVIDPNGVVVFDPIGRSEGASVALPELARMIGGQRALQTHRSQQSPAIDDTMHYLYEPVTVNGKEVALALAGYPAQPLEAAAQRHLRSLGLIGATAVAAVLFFLLLFLSRSILSPIGKLGRATETIARGNLSARVAIDRRDEFGRLGEAFNRMVGEIEALRKREQKLVLSRQEMVANISHDLRTPLSSIRGYVEGLLDGLAAEPERRQRYLQVIHDKTISMERQIEDLFELSRLEAGHLPMDFVRLHPGEMIADLAESLRYDAEAAGLSLEWKAPDNLPSLLADPTQIERVVANLVHNAIRHTKPGGRITITAALVDQELLFSVRDTGEGISPDDLPHVFQRLYRGDKSRAKAQGGTGLGLAIAREIIHAHGGRIWAESERRQGSVFYFTLPVILTRA
ncbi:HAMP domain-containing protein [Heliobacterium undosum]|uniref:histidine kinase n=1 Tax=Heliomicrobium undosum TaxID=121734 RepID=A0A845L6P6_9FIRM|nr:HAMP domain-containing sensor histidine kinase [Heliomicrobium undosum]MZP30705.1 HAMP domain-containing protein [Heliomicrobium undosum]